MPCMSISLILVDCLRLDRAKTMESYQQLVEGGREFTNHRTHDTWTFPALGSIHSGKPTPDHGMVTWAPGYPRPKLKANLTMAEAIKISHPKMLALGSGTCGWGSRAFGWDRGFDCWTDHGSYEDDMNQALDLPGHCKPPFFFFWHILQLHDWWVGSGKSPAEWRTAWRELQQGEAGQQAADLYDKRVQTTDQMISLFLRQHPPGPDHLVCMTADHGEILGDRGATNFIGHGGDILHPALVHIPLVLAGGPPMLNLPGSIHSGHTHGHSLMPLLAMLAQVANGNGQDLPNDVSPCPDQHLVGLHQMACRRTITDYLDPDVFGDGQAEDDKAVADQLAGLGYLDHCPPSDDAKKE